MKGWIGLPEESGGIPFALHFAQGQHIFLVLGITGESIDVLESTAFDPPNHGLIEIPIAIVASFLRRGFRGATSEEWNIVDSILPPSADTITLPVFDENLAKPTHRLRAPESGAYFAFSNFDIQEASAAIRMALQNPQVQNQLIHAAIDTLANISLTLPLRQRWGMALEAIAIVARVRFDDELAQCALQNASAILSGVDGSDIPFVRDWADQCLQSVVALARVVEKDKLLSEADSAQSSD